MNVCSVEKYIFIIIVQNAISALFAGIEHKRNCWKCGETESSCLTPLFDSGVKASVSWDRTIVRTEIYTVTSKLP